MKGDRELANLRQKYYGLFVKLFWKEPDTEFLLSLLDGIAERVTGSAQSSPLMSEGWKEIRHYLEKKALTKLNMSLCSCFLDHTNLTLCHMNPIIYQEECFRFPLLQSGGL